jgi:hypothetical protein
MEYWNITEYYWIILDYWYIEKNSGIFWIIMEYYWIIGFFEDQAPPLKSFF